MLKSRADTPSFPGMRCARTTSTRSTRRAACLSRCRTSPTASPTIWSASTRWRHATVITKDRRTAFEFGVTQGALAQNKPVLGICGGQQLLHVVLGGKLIQHIPDSIDDPLAHEQPNPRNEPGHVVKVAKGTQLHGIVGAEELQVNSAHHQAAADQPKGVVVNATAPDGVIEGIEAPAYRFCIGVQWHPEFLISEGDAKLFRAFLGAAAAK
jgi:putative glutamine amidotransferase